MNLQNDRVTKPLYGMLLAGGVAAWLSSSAPAASSVIQGASILQGQPPAISETVAPVESIAPIARDGHGGTGFLRKPPGAGPFPAVVLIHGGLATISTSRLRDVV